MHGFTLKVPSCKTSYLYKYPIFTNIPGRLNAAYFRLAEALLEAWKQFWSLYLSSCGEAGASPNCSRGLVHTLLGTPLLFISLPILLQSDCKLWILFLSYLYLAHLQFQTVLIYGCWVI